MNQDAGTAWTGVRADGTPVSLALVADGVSSGAHSEEASRLVVERVLEEMPHVLIDPLVGPTDVGQRLQTVLQAASGEMARRPHGSVGTADGTTVAAAICIGREAEAVWVGDSRVYLLSAGEIRGISRDHSWVEEIVAAGLMNEDEAMHDPRARMITRWLGPPEYRDIGVETARFTIRQPSTILCCSDGLYLYFRADPELLAEKEAAAVDVQDLVRDLVETALERGGHDDITASVIRVT